MKLNSEFGILIDRSEDKKFIKHFKDVFGRSLSKATDKSRLDARLPFTFKYFYFDFEKAKALYIEMEPNQDDKGVLQYPDRPDFGWILRFRIRDDFDHVDKEEVANQTIKNIKSLNFKTEFIRYQE